MNSLAVLRPVLKLLKGYDVVIIGDREFRSVELAYWLKKKGISSHICYQISGNWAERWWKTVQREGEVYLALPPPPEWLSLSITGKLKSSFSIDLSISWNFLRTQVDQKPALPIFWADCHPLKFYTHDNETISQPHKLGSFYPNRWARLMTSWQKSLCDYLPISGWLLWDSADKKKPS